MIQRPDGRPYRARKLVAYSVTDEDEIVAGAVVFGTHDPQRAQSLAQEVIDRDLGGGYMPADPSLVWWRDGFVGGHRSWVTDEKRGRAAVWFRQIHETVSVLTKDDAQ